MPSEINWGLSIDFSQSGYFIRPFIHLHAVASFNRECVAVCYPKWRRSSFAMHCTSSRHHRTSWHEEKNDGSFRSSSQPFYSLVFVFENLYPLLLHVFNRPASFFVLKCFVFFCLIILFTPLIIVIFSTPLRYKWKCLIMVNGIANQLQVSSLISFVQYLLHESVSFTPECSPCLNHVYMMIP